MADDCIFCKLISGEIPSALLYKDDEIVAFPDINPSAPIHLLIVPRRHIPSLLDINGVGAELIGKMTLVANRLAKEQGVAESGYRLVINCGKEGGQVVPHLHMHLLGGRDLRWGP